MEELKSGTMVFPRTIFLTALLLAHGTAGRAWAADPAPDCQKAVEEFKGWTAKMAQELKRAGCPMLFRADRKLVELEASAGAPPACAPTVEVAVDRILIDGFEIVVTDLESIGQGLGERLKALGDNFKALHPKAPAPAKLVLVIDRNAPWSFIVRVAAAISAAGYRRVGLVFAPTGLQLPPAPPSSSIDKPIEDIRWADPATRGSGLAYLSEKIMAPCPALGRASGSTTSSRCSQAACRPG